MNTYEEYITEEKKKENPEELEKDEKGVNTTDYPVPDSAVIAQPGDKIMAYVKSQFAAAVPYYTMGIRSVNTDLAKHHHNQEF